ncbi:hypothetical protein ABFS83_11G038400 [Erythranthe nasuta]
MSKPSYLHVFAVIIVCTTILATPSAADLLSDLGLIGGGLGLPDVRQCLAGIFEVHGCLHELIFSVLSLQPRLVGPTCCSAFLQIDEGCLPKVFPLHPEFTSLLQNYCLSVIDGSVKLPPPPPPCDSGDCDYY